ncbi:helix-turn-helix transcriptional regulator [Microvirga sp. STR05]|uniref:helix-turn-helix domain-containing protein n=1 Tax=Hymenobacter duratus TaxID=2771356 RepID=UPI001B8C68C1|nr:AraC family transcriptional regulator [Hymenobacter duratus]MBR7951795.1 helix-turn-helix transcriptional regulator [Microvirga sp. STR05]
MQYKIVELGRAELTEKLRDEQRQQLRLALMKSGLELLGSAQASLIEKTKTVIGEMLHDAAGLRKSKNSAYISRKLCYDYSYLSTIFSEATGGTIEQYTIECRIEQVKQLLLQRQLSLTQIAYELNYSSVAHLSNQFKKVTGLTPTVFKQHNVNQGIIPESGNGVTMFCNCVSIVETRGISFVACR